MANIFRAIDAWYQSREPVLQRGIATALAVLALFVAFAVAYQPTGNFVKIGLSATFVVLCTLALWLGSELIPARAVLKTLLNVSLIIGAGYFLSAQWGIGFRYSPDMSTGRVTVHHGLLSARPHRRTVLPKAFKTPEDVVQLHQSLSQVTSPPVGPVAIETPAETTITMHPITSNQLKAHLKAFQQLEAKSSSTPVPTHTPTPRPPVPTAISTIPIVPNSTDNPLAGSGIRCALISPEFARMSDIPHDPPAKEANWLRSWLRYFQQDMQASELNLSDVPTREYQPTPNGPIDLYEAANELAHQGSIQVESQTLPDQRDMPQWNFQGYQWEVHCWGNYRIKILNVGAYAAPVPTRHSIKPRSFVDRRPALFRRPKVSGDMDISDEPTHYDYTIAASVFRVLNKALAEKERELTPTESDKVAVATNIGVRG